VVYSTERDYPEDEVGFEPESEQDCYEECARVQGCSYFWYEINLPDKDFPSGQYCSLHYTCEETRKPLWKGITYKLNEPTTTSVAGGRRTSVRTTPSFNDVGYTILFDIDEHTDCTKGTKDDETEQWSNVVYATDREYYQSASGFEPDSEQDCYEECVRSRDCAYFWYEENLPDADITESGRFCELHSTCDETRKPLWKGITYQLNNLIDDSRGRTTKASRDDKDTREAKLSKTTTYFRRVAASTRS
jgi:hypothetical protein